jgi:hypothetical protein
MVAMTMTTKSSVIPSINNNKRKTIPVTLSWDDLKERLQSLSVGHDDGEDTATVDSRTKNRPSHEDTIESISNHDKHSQNNHNHNHNPTHTLMYNQLVHWKKSSIHLWEKCQKELCQSAHEGRLALQQKLQDEQWILNHETDQWHDEIRRQQELECTIGQCLEQKEQLDELEMKLRASIHEYHEMTRQELSELDFVEYERIQQVPKIKNQISLYARTTGIKWDYHREHILAGQVVGLQGVRSCNMI